MQLVVQNQACSTGGALMFGPAVDWSWLDSNTNFTLWWCFQFFSAEILHTAPLKRQQVWITRTQSSSDQWLWSCVVHLVRARSASACCWTSCQPPGLYGDGGLPRWRRCSRCRSWWVQPGSPWSYSCSWSTPAEWASSWTHTHTHSSVRSPVQRPLTEHLKVMTQTDLMARIFCPGVRCSSLRAIPADRNKTENKLRTSNESNWWTSWKFTVVDFKRQAGDLLCDHHHGAAEQSEQGLKSGSDWLTWSQPEHTHPVKSAEYMP